ncbi:hypothetical protein ALC62_01404 [Cyphomyrmex costatus]|uniref:C2H2-type domain-containing protein n=1 Tax=Cyphomyrmex costatus TaxID=456900 RepID=A0A195D582_9HYME|nr:hypothetical protein ALC62_01404 [Cyphomyrmex costatus]
MILIAKPEKIKSTRPLARAHRTNYLWPISMTLCTRLDLEQAFLEAGLAPETAARYRLETGKARPRKAIREEIGSISSAEKKSIARTTPRDIGVLHKCGTCNKEFKYTTHLRDHEKTHTGEKPYQCEFCKYKCGDERFKSNKDLYAGGKSHQCGTCNKEFKYTTHLRRHERTHTGEKPYQCEFCKYKCGQKVHLTRHVKLKHNNDERFKSNKDLYAGGVLHKCGTCNKEFKYTTHLRDHERTHTGEKPYQCEFCENKFSRKDGLIHHVKTKHKNDERLKSNEELYTGGESYKCGTCNKEFKNKAHLHIHDRTHIGEKPYHCEFCGDMFRWVHP